jgi:hypothetical protein
MQGDEENDRRFLCRSHRVAMLEQDVDEEGERPDAI